MSMKPHTGLHKPQQRGQAFVGAYIDMAAKRKLVAIAELEGTSITGMLARMIDHLDVDLDVSYPTGASDQEAAHARA